MYLNEPKKYLHLHARQKPLHLRYENFSISTDCPMQQPTDACAIHFPNTPPHPPTNHRTNHRDLPPTMARFSFWHRRTPSFSPRSLFFWWNSSCGIKDPCRSWPCRYCGTACSNSTKNIKLVTILIIKYKQIKNGCICIKSSFTKVESELTFLELFTTFFHECWLLVHNIGERESATWPMHS